MFPNALLQQESLTLNFCGYRNRSFRKVFGELEKQRFSVVASLDNDGRDCFEFVGCFRGDASFLAQLLHQTCCGCFLPFLFFELFMDLAFPTVTFAATFVFNDLPVPTVRAVNLC